MRTLLVVGDDGGDDDNSDSDADGDSNDEGDDDDDVEVGGDGDGKRRRKTVYRPVDTRKTPCLSRESSFLAKQVDTKLSLTRSFFLFFFRFFLLLPSHLFLSLSFFPTRRRSSKHVSPLLPPQNCNSRYDRILTSSTTCREKRSRSSRATATFRLPFPFSSTIYLSVYRTIDRSVVRST